MFNFSELLVIAMVALVVIGPKQLPTLAYKVGSLISTVNRLWQQLKQEFQQQADLEHNLARAKKAAAKQQTHD